MELEGNRNRVLDELKATENGVEIGDHLANVLVQMGDAVQ